MEGYVMERVLTLVFTPEKRDYVRASRVLSKQSKWFLVLSAVILLVGIGSGVLLLFPGLAGVDLQGVAPFVFIGSVVYMLYILWLIPLQLKRAYRTNPHMRLTRTLTFFESYLNLHMGEENVYLPWENLRQVIDDGNYLLLLFKGDQQVFPFIPGRAFDPLSSREQVLKFFRDKSIPVI